MRYCTNAACPAQLKQRLQHVVSRGALDIEGLGGKLTDRFVDLGLLHDVADLFTLDWDQIATLERLGEKSAANLRQAVEASKNRPLAQLLAGLGIRHIGERSATLLSERFSSLDALAAADVSAINAVGGIGQVLAQSVAEFFDEPSNLTVIAKLKAAGVRTADESATHQSATGPLLGKTVVVTGRLSTMTRPEAEEKLRRAGATVSGSVSKKTSFVVVGDDAGGKADRAKELNIPIVSEEDVIALIHGKPGTIPSDNGSASGNA